MMKIQLQSVFNGARRFEKNLMFALGLLALLSTQVLAASSPNPPGFTGQELPNLREQNVKHFRQPDGRISAWYANASLHYKKGNAWLDIDNRIQNSPNAAFLYQNVSNAFETFYPLNPTKASVKTIYRGETYQEKLIAVIFKDADGNKVGALSFPSEIRSRVNENQVIYQNIAKGLDLVYTQQNDGRKMELVIRTREALAFIPANAASIEIAEEMQLQSGMSIRMNNGMYMIYSGREVRASIQNPLARETMLSSKTYTNDADFLSNGNLVVENAKGSNYVVKTSFQTNWLRDPSRSFPLMLDPSLNYGPFAVSMATGYMTTATGAKTNGLLRIAGANTFAWAKFNTASFATAGSTSVDSVIYWGNFYSTTNATNKIAKVVEMDSLDPVTATNTTIVAKINAKTNLRTGYVYAGPTYTWMPARLDTAGINSLILPNSINRGFTTIGFTYISGATTFAYHYGWNGATNICYLQVYYTLPPCSNPISAGTTTGASPVCGGSSVTLGLSGASMGSGMTYQWQTSPDSVTWTNVTGATFDTYTNIVSNDSLYYRCELVCSFGTPAYSAPKKVMADIFKVTAATPYNEGFESITTANTLPACMSATNFGTITSTLLGPATTYNQIPRTGNKFGSFRYSCNDFFFSKGLKLQAGINYSFSTWYVTDGGYSGGWDSIALYVATAPNASSVTLLPGTSVTYPTNMTYQKLTGSFTPSVSGVYRLAFKVKDAGIPWYLSIDDISVIEAVAPTVLSGSASGITTASAILGGNITNDGGSAVTASGVVVSTSANPTRGGTGVIDSATLVPTASGTYTVNVAGLSLATTYHYRAYAVNAVGTSYGADSTFTTNSAAVAPTVLRIAATNIGGFTARVGGNITSDGGSSVYTSGVVVGTSPNPAIGGVGVIDSTTTPNVALGTYNFNLAGLNHSTKYYFRAYAINSVGTAYSVQDSFSTNPVINYLPYAQNFDTIGLNTGWSASAIGTGINNWALGTPAKTQISGAYSGSRSWVTALTGSYSSNANAAVVSPQFDFSALTVNPLFRFRHNFYAESGYDGGVLEVDTGNGVWYVIDNAIGTGGTFNTTASTGWYNGTGSGLPGNCWTLQSTGYTGNTNGWIQSMTTLTGVAGKSNVRIRLRFASDVSVEYEGWAFDNIEVFVPTAPAVVTGTKTNITTNSVTLAGNITSNGGNNVTVSGIVVGTSPAPSIGGTGVIDSITIPLVGNGAYIRNIFGLTAATTYYYRAYATNGIGTTYGADSTFTTNASAVAPTVLRVAASNIGGFTATVGGNITSDGGSSVYLSGVVVGTSPNPAIGGFGVIDSVTTPNVAMGTYSFNVAGLNHSTKYYFRAYAINGVGTSYSSMDSFNTNPVINYVPYAQNFDTVGVNTGWSTSTIGTGANNWVLGTPAKTQISGAYSGTKSWITGLSGAYSSSHNAAVVSPQFDFTSLTVNPLIRFRHNFYAESSYDGGVLEIDTGNGIWYQPDNSIGTGTSYNTANSSSWYNGTGSSVPGNCFTAQSTVYTGSTSGWIQSMTTLTGVAGKSNVHIRFRFASDPSLEYDGWALDNIEVFVPTAPLVTTGTKTAITTNSVILAGNISANGGSNVTVSGIVVGTSANPVIGGGGVIDSITNPLVGLGAYTKTIAGLSAATTYHYRAYATNGVGTTYGADSVFTTNASAVIPSVIRVAATNFTITGATLGGNITSDGGSAVFLSGVVVGTSPNPAIGGSGVIDSVTSPNVALGSYTFNVGGLTHSTKYYFRAYAINSVGTAYSVMDSFNTAPIISTFPYTQTFEAGANGWSSQLTSTNTAVNWIIGFATNNNWVLGTPSKTYLSGAHSGTKAWVTKLSGTYDIDHDASVVSPQFNFSGLTNDPVVRFYHKFKAESDWDGLIVEMSINGGYWRRIDSLVGTGTNFNTANSYAWYNDNVDNVSSGGVLAPPYFSNDIGSASVYASQSSGWIESAFRLPGAAGQSNVKFRFRFISDTYVVDEGWALDDIEVVNIVSPSLVASSVTATSAAPTTMNLSWSNGNGNARIVVARLSSTSAVAPTNNTMYGASAAFGGTNTTGTGNFIVYNGTGNSLTVTGLTGSTAYSFDVYEYNGKYMHNMFSLAATGSSTTLPVELLSFTGNRVEEDVLLNWSTASERNNKGFEVQRSLDGKHFKTIEFVKGKGNSSIVVNYALTDAKAFAQTGAQTLYYRLKQLDIDNTFSFSEVVTVNFDGTITDQVSLYPNPFVGNSGISVKSASASDVQFEIVDMQGRVMHTGTLKTDAGTQYHTLSDLNTLSAGIYFVRVKLNDALYTFKVQKME